MNKLEPSASSAQALVRYLLERGIAGVPPLSSAESLATEYLIDNGYEDNDQRVESLINWETSKNFTTGFLTGLGGFITLPVAIPSALGASWLIQARMSGAIARIYDHDLADERVRTMILLSLAGGLPDFLLRLTHRLARLRLARGACLVARRGIGTIDDEPADTQPGQRRRYRVLADRRHEAGLHALRRFTCVACHPFYPPYSRLADR